MERATEKAKLSRPSLASYNMFSSRITLKPLAIPFSVSTPQWAVPGPLLVFAQECAAPRMGLPTLTLLIVAAITVRLLLLWALSTHQHPQSHRPHAPSRIPSPTTRASATCLSPHLNPNATPAVSWLQMLSPRAAEVEGRRRPQLVSNCYIITVSQ